MRKKTRLLAALTVTLACFMVGAMGNSACAQSETPPMMTKWGRGLNTDNVLPDYPRPQMMRQNWHNLNGYWELQINRNTNGETQPGETSGTPLPVLVPFPIESQLSGIGEHAASVTYKKRFRIPGAWPKNQRVLLHFGAVDWETVVHVNGKYIGTHRGGYDSFSFDITEALLPDSEQTLVVMVNDPTEQGSQPRGDQSTVKARDQHASVTGIWQTVWLEPVPEASIRRLQLTPDFDGKSIKLQIFGENLSEKHVVKAELFDGDEFITRGFGGHHDAMILRIPEEHFQPWSPESPYLYQLSIALLENNNVVDQVSSYTGIRKIEIVPLSNGRATIHLNEKPFFQKGVAAHGMWPDGHYTAPSEQAMQSDLTVARTLGFNTIRKTAKIEPDRWYHLCDMMGLLVWQEFPTANNHLATATAQFDVELGNVARQLENHPSLVGWAIFQQGKGEHNPQYYADKMRQINPGRLLCISSGSASQTHGNISDVYMMPELQPMMYQSSMAQTIGRFGGIDLYDKENSWSSEHWGYSEVLSTLDLIAQMAALVDSVIDYRDQFDVSAAVYHQLIDLEEETNGLVTYNRELLKVPPEEIKKLLDKLQYAK